jgi:hypothetical protein
LRFGWFAHQLQNQLSHKSRADETQNNAAMSPVHAERQPGREVISRIWPGDFVLAALENSV